MFKSLGSNKNFLTELISSGADAQTNLYYLAFSGGEVSTDATGGVSSNVLAVRSKDFTPPKFTQKVNQIKFMTTNIDFPMASVSGAKEVKFNFRVDTNYAIYKFLMDQMAVTSKPSDAYATNDVPSGFIISAYAAKAATVASENTAALPVGTDVKTNSSYELLYTFKRCWVKNITGLTYNYQQANPVTVSATIGFYEFDEPSNLMA